MIEKCKYPLCHQKATKTWALVPLCPTHFNCVYDETIRHYLGKNDIRIKDDERLHYTAISHLTPWGRKR